MHLVCLLDLFVATKKDKSNICSNMELLLWNFVIEGCNDNSNKGAQIILACTPNVVHVVEGVEF